jgi:hypothetical protein
MISTTFGGTVCAIVAIVKNKLAQKAPWLALPLRAISTLGEGQEPESASGEARSRGGLGALIANGQDAEIKIKLVRPH